jgi:hypothetical protein
MQTPWAVILCKFTDGNDEPFPMQYYNDLFTTNDAGSPWNMVRYFRDYSHGKLDLTGTKVFGWLQLNKSVADYNSLGGQARDQLIKWARAAAAAWGRSKSIFQRGGLHEPLAGHRGITDLERCSSTGTAYADPEATRPRDGPCLRANAFPD